MLTKLQKNWRGMTVSSAFQVPGFVLLTIVLLSIGITILLTGHIENVEKPAKNLSNPLNEKNQKILFDATDER